MVKHIMPLFTIGMKKKYTLLWFIALILIIIIALVLRSSENTKNIEIIPSGNFEEKTDLITIDNPKPNQKIGSPITITGKARGNWYFEASFPVELVDANGNQLAVSPAQAEGDWMTTDFVPYSVTLTFPVPATPTGKLILHKDNPSGLPQNDDQLIMPIVFY